MYEAMRSNIDELYEDTRNQKQGRSKVYLSAIGSTELGEMSVKAGLIYLDVEVPLVGQKAGTEGFEWQNCPEKAQADR